MADDAVLLKISEMIDLAIGSPEVGVVDFNMLQTVLHCLAQQLRILGKNVELRGSVGGLPTLPTKDNAQTIAISEYIVDTDDDAAAGGGGGPPVTGVAAAAKLIPKPEKPAKERTERPASPKTDEPETILVVERVRKSVSAPSGKPTGQETGSAAEGAKPTPKIGIKPAVTGGTGGSGGAGGGGATAHPVSSTERLSLVTISKFNILENIVEDLKDRVYGSMPKNDQILEEVRSQTNLKAITDMWTSLNVSSRLEAAEEGIGKLSSLVQDLISESTGLQDAVKQRDSKTREVVQAVSETGTSPDADATEGTQVPAVSPSAMAIERPGATKQEIIAIQKRLKKMRTDLDQLTRTFYKAMEEVHASVTDFVPPPSPPGGSEGSEGGEAGEGGEGGEGGEEQLTTTSAIETHYPRQSFSVLTAELMTRINELEAKLNKCCDTIGKNDGVIQDQINSFQDQLEYLMKQVSAIAEDMMAGKLSPDLIKDLQGLMQLFTTVQEMQEQLQQVHETALQLAAEKEDRQHNINALLEQIELLKTVKLDREDMVEAMAEKADLRMLARKVSHDQFELACDDLSRGLEHALGKLSLQEALWQQALDDIQREIEMKLDKMELSPVKEFFNNKLRQLQENLKQMALLRKEAEAAGTKKKLLRDVNCISCDANAVMPMETSTVPVLRPMPANLSMKPYLSYELDAIRKSQQSNVPHRNMHDWEAIDKVSKTAPKAKSEPDKPEKHLCNRYCGGSHTVTTPAQRVARTGHFIKQWGPDVLPLSSGLAAGDDGRLYKVSPVEGANVGPGGAVDTTCTPKPPAKPEKPKSPQRSLIISAECRCLEGERPSKI